MVWGELAKTGAELGGAEVFARKWYTWKYPHWFRAGGRYSRVLVPRFAARVSVGLAVFGTAEAWHCYEKCKCKAD
jgi:hypothetical protein